jgi:hypothetical protein
VFTTNFDDLIEQSYRQAEHRLNVIIDELELAFWSDERVQLIKLCGDLQRPDSIVITKEDFNNYPETHRRLTERLRTVIENKTVLFLGLSPQDPFVSEIWDRVSLDFGKYRRVGYAVMFGASALDRDDWRRRGVHIIDIEAAGADQPTALANWLERLMTDEPQSSGKSGSLGIPVVTSSESPTCWGGPADTLNKLGTPARQSREIPKTRKSLTPPSEVGSTGSETPETQVENGKPGNRKPHRTHQTQPRSLAWVDFRVQLAHQNDLQFEARAIETPMGQPLAIGHLSVDMNGLVAVLKLLEHRDFDGSNFSSTQIETLEHLGLIRNGVQVHDAYPRIGKSLYEALFADQVGVAFQVAFTRARENKDAVSLQLRFDPDAVNLAHYPWELLHDGQRHLLSGNAVQMTRYITYGEAIPSLPAAPPWRVLFISSRPQDLTALPPDTERLAVWNALQPLEQEGKLTLEKLNEPTYNALLECTASTDYHIIHFDGHGIFGRRCPRCKTMHYPHISSCQSCAASLGEVPPLGYLAFEDDAGKADMVSTADMENLLLNSQTRLVFLSTCQSSVVRGESMFGGLGPGLIRAGVPAVVAMQFSMPVKAAVDFAASFYKALTRGETISRAVAQGRRRLFRDSTWFIPTLYLRSQDDEGYLFAA